MAKSSFAALGAVSVMLVLACEQAPTSADTLTPPDIRAAIKMVDDNVTFPVVMPIDNPCTPPEDIVFTGTQHVVFKVWDTNGSGFWDDGDRLLFNFQNNLRGTDSNGISYVMTDSNHGTGRQQGPPPWTGRAVQRVISSTDVDNFLARFKITVNANGVVTVLYDSGKCAG